MNFMANYRNIVDVVQNLKPLRLPLYEHIISPQFMDKLSEKPFSQLYNGTDSDLKEFFRRYCNFFQEMTYDTVSYEVCLAGILPDGGAIYGGRPGPIQNRNDFKVYPWDELLNMFIREADHQFALLAENLPPGMKVIGGIGNGVLEISENLIGYEYLCYLLADDPDLVADTYTKIGDLMVSAWQWFLNKYSTHFCVCRFGDDLGHKTGLLIPKSTFTTYILPQYKRIIAKIKSFGKPFLWHSCGNIFEIMDDMISLGINAKHSNEDIIAPFDKWIELYSNRIALMGGIDVDLLCQNDEYEIYNTVIETGTKYRETAKGYALGSGNSIPEYVPVESYLAMIRAVQQIRYNEAKK